MNKLKIIAAVRNNKELQIASNSKVANIFMLSPNISDIKRQTELVHSEGKKIFIHLDMAEGIGKDEYGIRFAKEQGVDGIISTRTNIIKMAKKEGLFTVQRFFLIDSQSVATTIETAKTSKADMIEIMPGTLSKIIKKLKEELKVPIVAGGLIETEEEINDVISCGAAAISTGKQGFWG
ncbi:MAG: glycerol-3-phosphate responsive antiterminator [Oscillospiraceae bacterium]|nr:glycerol-3-phosphate responsive antiterminator [Oscillospiraceae bacterium]